MAAAWMGYGAGCLPPAGRRELGAATYAAFACLAYGLLLDLWFWPFGAGTSSTLSFQLELSGPQPGPFLLFHSATSLGFDLPEPL